MAEFKIGDLVWAKMKGFPAWPGKVVEPNPKVKKPSADKKAKQFVFFFGSENYAWVAEDMMWSYVDNYDKYLLTGRLPRGFQEAVDAMKELVAQLPPEQQVARKRSRSPSPASSRGKEPKATPPSAEPRPKEPKLATGERSKTAIKPREDGGKKKTQTPKDVKKRDSGEARSHKARAGSMLSGTAVPRSRLLEKDPVSPLSTPASMFDFDDSITPRSSAKKSESSAGDDLKHSFMDQPFLPDVLPSMPETKNIIATPLKIGFLGLGIMGSGMVDNLLRSGHEVTVWNRTGAKCREFIKEGALKGSHPSEVVQQCDITFSCVSDPMALKDLVFGNCGVLQGITTGKGFVDLSTVDVETVNDISEAITARGGRFLEAPVVGSKELAKAGQLVILAAGDKTLYDDCFSCFQSMGRRMFFVGGTGFAVKMKLVVNLLIGTTLAGLAESMALAEKIGLDTKEVLNILGQSTAASSFLRTKGTDMALNRLSEPSCKLLTMQKDLRLAINMSDQVDQPLHVGSAVNELFKKAKAKGYGEYDIAAVYRAADL